MKVLISLSILIIFYLGGCASDVANRYYIQERFPPRDVETVTIFTEKPTRDFVVIADFQSRGESAIDMQRKAAEIGADAVIITLLGGYYSAGDKWAGNDRYSKTYARIAGTAIKFK